MGSSSILKYDPFRRHLLDISSGRGLVRMLGVAQVESVLKLLKLSVTSRTFNIRTITHGFIYLKIYLQ
jgi:hypothetical protein